jgi:hypothetical protein
MAIEHPNEDHDLVLHFSEVPAARKAARSEKWQMQWDNSDKGRLCHSILPEVREKPWYKLTNFDRQSIVFWNRIIANHTRCKRSLHRFGIVESPTCSCERSYETVNHLVFDCCLTSDDDMKQNLREIGFHPPWNIRDIIVLEINEPVKPAMKIISEAMAKKLINLKKI